MSVATLERPPARLPSGKANPEYTRWYRTTEKGRAVLEKSKSRPDYLKREAERKRKAYRQTYPNGARTCVECRSVYRSEDVIARGWRMIGLHSTLCDLCAEGGAE